MTLRLSAPIFSATLFLAAGLSAQEPNLFPEAPTADQKTAVAVGLAPPAPSNHTLTPLETELLKQYDRKGGGKIDEEDLATAHESMRRKGPEARGGPKPGQAGAAVALIYSRLLAGFDKNHDGQLDAGEQAEAVKYVQEHNPRLYQFLVQRFGADGKLDSIGTAKAFETLKKQSARTASR